MSRYLILVLLNLPLIIGAIFAAFIDFKMKKIPFSKFLIRFLVWIFILSGLVSSQYLYNYLFNKNLTRTEPLSLFDVIQISGIIWVLFIANRSRIKVERLERKVVDLHQQLSIIISQSKNTTK